MVVFDAPEVGTRVRDDTTSGDWKGRYGADGWEIPGCGRKSPESVMLDTSQAGDTWTWNGDSTKARALKHPTEAARRVLPSWFGDTVTFTVDTGATTRRVALYLVDGGTALRAATRATRTSRSRTRWAGSTTPSAPAGSIRASGAHGR